MGPPKSSNFFSVFGGPLNFPLDIFVDSKGTFIRQTFCVHQDPLKKTRASRTKGAKGNNLFASNSELQISSIVYQVSDSKYPVSIFVHQGSGIKYYISDFKYDTSNIRYQV